MPHKATATFNVTGWDDTPYFESESGPRLSRATIKKSFVGDMEGESAAEMLGCQADINDFKAGAGYVVSELFEGVLAGKKGTFVLHHWGIVSPDGSQKTAGHVVPGSGTGELAGLSGTMEISVAEDGTHTLTLDYELG